MVIFELTRPLHQYGLTVYGIFKFITNASQDITTPTRTTDLTSYVYNPETGTNIDLDIAMAHPWSSDIFPKSAEKDKSAAKRREEQKMDKYRKVRLPGGSMVKVPRLVLKHFGRWGEERKKFLQMLSKHSLDKIGRPNAPEFIDYWRKRFSVQLQKCNAKVLLKKSSALSSDGVNKLVSYCTQFFSH